MSVGGNPGDDFDNAVKAHNAANDKLPEFGATVSGQRNGSHINAILRIHRDGKHAQTFEAGAGRLAYYMMEREHKAAALKHHKDVIMDSRTETMLGPNNDKRNGVGYALPAPDLKAQVEALKKTRPVGLLRLVLTVRSTTPVTSGVEDVLFVSRIQRSYGDATHQNFSVSRLMWSLRNTPGFTNIQPWWIVFLPRANVAKAMWAQGAREVKLSQIIADQKKKDGLVISVDYIDSLILTNMADPCGAVTRYAETKSSPPDGDPRAGATAISLSGQPIPKFFRDPLPGKSFSGQQGRVILPQLWGLPTMVNDKGQVVQTYAKVGNVLAWNDSYLRSDIQMDRAVPAQFTEEW